MADNVTLPGIASVVATDDVGSAHYQWVKVMIGADGVVTALAVGAGAVDAGTPRITWASDSPGLVTDDGAFTPGTTKVMMAGFEFDDTTPDSVNEGDGGAARMSARREVYVQVRDAAGNERGLNVDASGQLGVVVGAGTANIGDVDVLSVTGIVPPAGEYETVAASQTGQALGATGATGDYLKHLLVIPATVSPGNVIILDNAISITVFPGGTNSVLTLHPFIIAVEAYSVSGAWKVTTGANVSVLAVGNFT